jgi:3,4-dihydroxy 2-butanone 4-phosphate synthase
MHPVSTVLQAASVALRSGQPVLLYDADGREGETDIVYASEHTTPEAVRHLRTDGGGLVCTTVAPEHHAKLGLPFLVDLLADAAGSYPVLGGMGATDVRYDANKSSFGITVNHRKTFTGIPDADRSLTVTELARFLRQAEGLPEAEARKAFGASFRAPGHVILLNGHPQGLAARQGHTELSLELARIASCVPSTTICEMLDPGTGRAKSRKAAEAYAKQHGFVFLTGQDILDAWNRTSTTASRPKPTVRAPTSAS